MKRITESLQGTEMQFWRKISVPDIDRSSALLWDVTFLFFLEAIETKNRCTQNVLHGLLLDEKSY